MTRITFGQWIASGLALSLVIALPSCSSRPLSVAVLAPEDEGCPIVVLERTGGLGHESQGGVMAAVWRSGAIVRAESFNRPGDRYVRGRLRIDELAELLGKIESVETWSQSSGDVALDMSDDRLTMRRGDERREWAETPGVTSTPLVAWFRERLRAVAILSPVSTRQVVEICQ